MCGLEQLMSECHYSHFDTITILVSIWNFNNLFIPTVCFKLHSLYQQLAFSSLSFLIYITTQGILNQLFIESYNFFFRFAKDLSSLPSSITTLKINNKLAKSILIN